MDGAIDNLNFLKMVGDLLLEDWDDGFHGLLIKDVSLVDDRFEVLELVQAAQDGCKFRVIDTTVVKEHSPDVLVEKSASLGQGIRVTLVQGVTLKLEGSSNDLFQDG